MRSIKLAQVGFGVWGKNLTRAFMQAKHASLVAISDQNENFLDLAKLDYPEVRTYIDWKELLREEIDGVVISTPPATHFEIAKFFLENGKHVFVEKPVTLAFDESLLLSQIAKEKECVLMAGHTFLYHSGIQYIKNNLESLGDLLYMKSSRMNFGRIRSDVNAWWNLAPHDISIFLYLMDEELPESVSVEGYSYIQESCPDYIRGTLTWKNGLRGFIDMTWLAPCKDRSLALVGRDNMYFFNDLYKEKVEFHKKYMTSQSTPKKMCQQFSNGVEKPNLSEGEPLFMEASHFIECISEKKSCLTGSKHILNVMKVLELGQRSIEANGKELRMIEFDLMTSNL